MIIFITFRYYSYGLFLSIISIDYFNFPFFIHGMQYFSCVYI